MFHLWGGTGSGFQSTPPCGGDEHYGTLGPEYIKFQSTPPCGGDINVAKHPIFRGHFNPRPLAGATPWTSWLFTFCLISIHAPLRGRHYRSRGPSDHPDFNPRPLAGATCIFWTSQAGLLDFNPRPLAGATNAVRVCPGNARISIHAPLRGRPPCRSFSTIGSNFNPRPLAGATASKGALIPVSNISIHAPLRGRRRKSAGINSPR